MELYRSTPGATVAGIAADLGVMDTTLSTWIKAAGVPVRGQSRPRSVPVSGEETPEVLTLSGDSYRTRARRDLLAKDRDNSPLTGGPPQCSTRGSEQARH